MKSVKMKLKVYCSLFVCILIFCRIAANRHLTDSESHHLGVWQLGSLEGRRALLTVPEFAGPWLLAQADAWEVEPLVHASFIIARDHITIAHVIAEAVSGLLARSGWDSIITTRLRARRCIHVHLAVRSAKGVNQSPLAGASAALELLLCTALLSIVFNLIQRHHFVEHDGWSEAS